MTHSFPKRRSSDLAKGERGVVGDAPLLAIGLAAIDAVVEGAIEIAVLDLLIPGDLRVEYAPERRAAEDGAKHAWIGAVLVQPARTLVGLGVIEDRRAADRSEEHTSELQSLMRISYAVFCLQKTKPIHT